MALITQGVVVGVTMPLTTASPSPALASMMDSARAPVMGLAVKSTPAASAGTRRCTMTASFTGTAAMP